jgi:hypothetical protein
MTRVGVGLHVRSHPGVARNNSSSHAKEEAVRVGTGAATLSEVAQRDGGGDQSDLKVDLLALTKQSV